MSIDNKPHETSIFATLALPFSLFLPLGLVLMYRWIPGHIRYAMFPGRSTSGLAVADMMAGTNGWTAIRKHARIKL